MQSSGAFIRFIFSAGLGDPAQRGNLFYIWIYYRSSATAAERGWSTWAFFPIYCVDKIIELGLWVHEICLTLLRQLRHKSNYFPYQI